MRRVAPFAGIKGMNRDLAASKFNSEFAYEIKNMRIMPNKENTLMALVNEIGTQYSGIELQGTPVGQAVLDDILVIFTTTKIEDVEDSEKNTESIDRIYKIQFVNGELKIVNPLYPNDEKPIYEGFLNFDMKHPLETIVFYENEDLQKVYWVDGKNQPRVINIAAAEDIMSKWTESNGDSFNFVRVLSLEEDVTITRVEAGGGMFHSGVIQYVFTYIDKYMQETNPFYTSPLYYTSYENRGGSPEDTVSCSFNITINNLDLNFDYVRIYSILRTSLDAEPTCKLVAELATRTETFTTIKQEWTEGDNVSDMELKVPTDEIYLLYLDEYGYYQKEKALSEYDLVSNGTWRFRTTDYKGLYSENICVIWDAEEDMNVEITPLSENTEGNTVRVSPESGKLYIYNRTESKTENSSNSVSYTDDGTHGSTIDPTELLYVGGEEVSAGTLEQKDNTLFLGDIQLLRSSLNEDLNEELKKQLQSSQVTFRTDEYKQYVFPEAKGYYPYESRLVNNSEEIKTFKYLETYRFGIQAQHKTGRWSDVVWLGDERNTVHIDNKVYDDEDNYVRMPYAMTEINKSILEALKESDYVKIRPVIVYPEVNERECVCQGVVCPTVYNVGDRYENGPFAQASWFTRPCSPYFYTMPSDHRGGMIGASNLGVAAEWRHNHAIPDSYHANCEIQCITSPPSSPRLDKSTYSSNDEVVQWVANNMENYFIDQSIVTLHSPDIEFDTDLRGIDTTHLKFRIVGVVPITAFNSAIDIQTSTPALNYNNDSITIAEGFYKEPVGVELEFDLIDGSIGGTSAEGWKSLIAAPMWVDTDANKNGEGGQNTYMYAVYPWHRNGSLNNQASADENGYRSAMLDKKRMSNLRVSYKTYFLNEENNDDNEGINWKGIWTPPNGISGMVIFDSNEMTMVRVPSPENSSMPDINYYGNIDKVIITGRSSDIQLYDHEHSAIDGKYKSDGYPITASREYDKSGDSGTGLDRHSGYIAQFAFLGREGVASGNPVFSSDPIRMKYKSTPHAVLAFNNTIIGDNNYSVILPTFNTLGGPHEYMGESANDDIDGFFFWNKKLNGTELIYQQSFSNLNIGRLEEPEETELGIGYGYLWLGEFYREDVQNRFGGTTEEAFETNTWLPCGEPVSILDDDGNIPDNVIVRWTEGDTYYMRYDHIKTYPYTTEDQNSVTDIISFMCETRINLDGRYDRNRGQVDNLSITPENFNLMNDVYNQANDFFTFNYLNSKKINLDNFRNVITWTKTKTAGDLVDTWTNITVASTLDLDGDKGNVNKLKRFNNELLAFQDTGISQILYNETMQIASTEGVPIEIANSGKVQGKRYLANQAGCINKWSMCETPAGLYFIDDINKTMYLFNGQFGKLSEQFGFTSWINSQLGSMEAWNPIDFNNFVTYYDKCNHDIYFINSNYCLAFSESLGQFTSFYDYNAVPYFANLQDRGIWIGKSHFDTLTEHEYKLWLHNEGEYNSYFNETMPYWLTVVANPEMQMDKVFDNIEFRSDTYSDELGLLHSRTFDTLRAYNEYQDTGEVSLKNIWAKPSSTSNLKKKFRIWRAIIPRDKSGNGRNRIRNPWTYLTLKMKDPQNYKTILHDLMVYYFDSLPNSSNNGNGNEE